MKTKEDFSLVGHLQVLDEPLASLYKDSANGKYFLIVRVYEETEDFTYLISEVVPSSVIEYMNGKVGLKNIFDKSNGSFFYRRKKNEFLTYSAFKPLTSEQAINKLSSDGVEDTFDKELAYRSVPLKNYLKSLRN